MPLSSSLILHEAWISLRLCQDGLTGLGTIRWSFMTRNFATFPTTALYIWSGRWERLSLTSYARSRVVTQYHSLISSTCSGCVFRQYSKKIDQGVKIGNCIYTLGFITLDFPVGLIRAAQSFHLVDSQMTYHLCLDDPKSLATKLSPPSTINV